VARIAQPPHKAADLSALLKLINDLTKVKVPADVTTKDIQDLVDLLAKWAHILESGALEQCAAKALVCPSLAKHLTVGIDGLAGQEKLFEHCEADSQCFKEVMQWLKTMRCPSLLACPRRK